MNGCVLGTSHYVELSLEGVMLLSIESTPCSYHVADLPGIGQYRITSSEHSLTERSNCVITKHMLGRKYRRQAFASKIRILCKVHPVPFIKYLKITIQGRKKLERCPLCYFFEQFTFTKMATTISDRCLCWK